MTSNVMMTKSVMTSNVCHSERGSAISDCRDENYSNIAAKICSDIRVELTMEFILEE